MVARCRTPVGFYCQKCHKPAQCRVDKVAEVKRLWEAKPSFVKREAPIAKAPAAKKSKTEEAPLEDEFEVDEPQRQECLSLCYAILKLKDRSVLLLRQQLADEHRGLERNWLVALAKTKLATRCVGKEKQAVENALRNNIARFLSPFRGRSLAHVLADYDEDKVGDVAARVSLAHRRADSCMARTVHHEEEQITGDLIGDLLRIFLNVLQPFLLERVTARHEGNPLRSITNEKRFVQDYMKKVYQVFRANCGSNTGVWNLECHVKEFFRFMLQRALVRGENEILKQWTGFWLEDWEQEEVFSDMLKCHIAGSSLLDMLS